MKKLKLKMMLDILFSLITAVFILILSFTQNVSVILVISYVIIFIIFVILKEKYGSKQKRSDDDGNN